MCLDIFSMHIVDFLQSCGKLVRQIGFEWSTQVGESFDILCKG